MRIIEAHVDRYGPLSRRRITPEPGLNVVFGPNEAGKTLLLEGTLRLLEPAITKTMPSLLRVDEDPHGYVRAERDEDEVQYDGNHALSEDTELRPEHLANIFVVRESDFSVLGDEHSFYSSVTEHIGDLHTSTLDLIERELISMGRLTAKERKISSAEGKDHAGQIQEQAEALAEEIEAYIEEAEAEGLDELEGELLDVRAQLRAVEKDVKALDGAERVRRHQRLKGRLDTYAEVSTALEELEGLSHDSLQVMVSNRDTITNERNRISSLQDKIDNHKERVETLEEQATNRRDELAPLEERSTDVAEVKASLEQFRERHPGGEGLEDTEKLALRLGIGALAGGLLLQALSFGLGRGLAAVALVVALVGVIGLAGYGVLRSRRQRRESEGARLVRAAQDAGLEVERREEIASELRFFESEVEGLKERIEEIGDEIKSEKKHIETYEGQIGESRETVAEKEEEIEEVLGEVDLDSIDEYRNQLETKEELEDKRNRAKQSLIDAVGDPEGKNWEENVEDWEADLAGLIEGVEEDVDSSDYDEELHHQKQSQLEDLREEEGRLSGRLDEHRDRIGRFEHRLQDEIQAEPFLGRSLQLEAATTDGLRALTRELQSLANRIERDAEVSRLALEVLDGLRTEEERKITDLFAADGPATQAFHQISDGRYERVRYDPEEQTLKVTQPDGRELVPEQLSKGAREQLYLAARLGLAERVLGADQGFFLLDDPLLPADRERLAAGFEVLQSIAEKGWQILYFTSKEEVRQRMVEEFDLPLAEFGDRL